MSGRVAVSGFARALTPTVALLVGGVARAQVDPPDPPVAPQGAPAADAVGVEPLGDVDSRTYLAELTRYLYRWHLDETELRPALRAGEVVYHVRRLERALDEGDESRFAEVVLPRLGVRVMLKRASYRIPELGISVRNDHHMVTRVDRFAPSDALDAPDPDTTVVRIPDAWLRDHLFRTRSQVRPPDDELLARMRDASREQLARHLAESGLEPPTEPQTIHLAPISRVANEAWAHWEEGRLLLRFHADIDLDEHDDWAMRRLDVDLFDLDEQVVVTLDEVAGSNAYVTRDFVGRMLFNCVVLGRRVTIAPRPADAPE